MHKQYKIQPSNLEPSCGSLLPSAGGFYQIQALRLRHDWWLQPGLLRWCWTCTSGGQTWFFFFFFFFITLMWAGSCSSPCERVLRLTPIKPLFVAKVVKGQRRWHFNGAPPIQPFNVVTGRCRRLWTNHVAERGRGHTGYWLAADTSDWSLHNCGCTEPKIKHLLVFQYMSSIFIYLFIFLIYFCCVFAKK